MTIGISTAMRNSRLQLILDAIDAESDEYSPAHLLIYSGTKPATGEILDEYDDAVLLADFLLPYPCGIITDGVLTFGTIEDVVGLVNGIAVWARITDADDVFVMDLTVTDYFGNGDVKVDNLQVYEDAAVHCTIAVITEGNA